MAFAQGEGALGEAGRCKLVKEGPPEGKEQRHPEMYYNSVLKGSRLVAEECLRV